MRRAALLMCWASMMLAACGDADPASPDMAAEADAEVVAELDAAPVDAAPETSRFTPTGPPGALRLGTGEAGFEPIADGATVTLHRGCQGAQHVWLSLWLPDAEPGAWALSATLLDAEDEPLTPRLRLADEPWSAADAGGAQLVGLTLVVFEPDVVIGPAVRLWAEVEGPSGRVSDVVEVYVEWGADAC